MQVFKVWKYVLHFVSYSWDLPFYTEQTMEACFCNLFVCVDVVIKYVNFVIIGMLQNTGSII